MQPIPDEILNSYNALLEKKALPFGHADVRTTMIYTHCIPSKTAKERKSPLDF